MFVSDIIKILEQWAPTEYSEDFDNVGLLTGDPEFNFFRCAIEFE